MAGPSTSGDASRLRVSAVLWPAAALALGWALTGSRGGRVLIRSLAGATALGGIVLAIAGRRGAAVESPAPADDDASIQVVIPARDEAHVIGGLIGDLGRQAPRSGFHLVVVDDRSTDGTGEAAVAAIKAAVLSGTSRVVRRAVGPDGKAATLAFAADTPDRPIAVLVLDADARVDPWFLARCRRSLADGSSTATARRRVLRSPRMDRFGRWLVEAQAAEQAADDVVQRGRLALGGAGELRANGMLIRADILANVGGWPADSLTEDLDLSTRIYLRTGLGATRPAGLEVWEQAATRPRAMLTQRLRWAEGSVRRDLAIVVPALTDPSIPRRRRLDVAGSAAQDVAPWLILGVAARMMRFGAARPVAELALGYAVAAAAIALAADEPEMPGLQRIAGVLGLGITWAVILPIAWLRIVRRPGRPAFRPTPHLPSAAVRPPPFATAEDPSRTTWPGR